MKFDLDVNETRISATSLSEVDGSEVRIHVSIPWAVFGISAPTAPIRQPSVQLPLVNIEGQSQEISNG